MGEVTGAPTGREADGSGGGVAQVVPLVTTRALDRALDYRVPEGLTVERGQLVAVRIGPRPVLGVVVSREAPTWEGTLAPIAGVVAAAPVPVGLMDLALWMADYYLAPLAGCLKLVLPPGADGVLRRRADGSFGLGDPPSGEVRRLVCRLREGATASGRRGAILDGLRALGGSAPVADLCRAVGTTGATLRRLADAGLVHLAEEGVPRSSLAWFGEVAGAAVTAPVMTAEQTAALAEVGRLLDGPSGGLLLHGVTGSGKTEVYLGAIEAAIARGGRSIVLVPEIALTPQLMARVRARFGARVAAWHSGLAAGERAAEDRRIRQGRWTWCSAPAARFSRPCRTCV